MRRDRFVPSQGAGSTVATNAIVEGRGARTGMPVTNLRYDFARTRMQRPPTATWTTMTRTMQALEEEATARLAAGNLVRIPTPEEGGWGAPFERPAGKVRPAGQGRDDVLDRSAIDEPAPRVRPAALQAAPSGMFHRGGWFDGDRADAVPD